MPDPSPADALALDVRPDRLVVSLGAVELLHLVHDDPCDPWEGPKPHLHPVRTTSGALVTGYRPHGHRWHKGFQVTLTHVDPERGTPHNFWGGNTYVRGSGYLPLPAVGSTRHLGYERAEVVGGGDGAGERVEVSHRLEWLTSSGERWFAERRTLVVHSARPGAGGRPGTWAFDLVSDLTNTAGQVLRVGSPTTHGRPGAGYCGFFWRGPRAWTGGRVLSPAGGTSDADAMGAPASLTPWLAVSGEHDDVDGGATVVVVADLGGGDPAGPLASAPADWFVRSAAFPALAPSPAFHDEVVLAPGAGLRLAHRVLVADAQLDAGQVAAVLDELAAPERI